jgi:hypothetical protein
MVRLMVCRRYDPLDGLRYRKAIGNTEVVALDEIERSLATKKIDIAVNIHSFPECRLKAIEWWVSRL